VREPGLAVPAQAHQAPRSAHGGLLRFQFVVAAAFEFGEKLRGCVRELEAVGIGLFPEFYDLLEIFLPLPVLLKRFKGQALFPFSNSQRV